MQQHGSLPGTVAASAQLLPLPASLLPLKPPNQGSSNPGKRISPVSALHEAGDGGACK